MIIIMIVVMIWINLDEITLIIEVEHYINFLHVSLPLYSTHFCKNERHFSSTPGEANRTKRCAINFAHTFCTFANSQCDKIKYV